MGQHIVTQVATSKSCNPGDEGFHGLASSEDGGPWGESNVVPYPIDGYGRRDHSPSRVRVLSHTCESPLELLAAVFISSIRARLSSEGQDGASFGYDCKQIARTCRPVRGPRPRRRRGSARSRLWSRLVGHAQE